MVDQVAVACLTAALLAAEALMTIAQTSGACLTVVWLVAGALKVVVRTAVASWLSAAAQRPV